MPNVFDIFNNDAFSLTSLTGVVNSFPYKPGKIGSLGIFEEKPVNTLSVMLEENSGNLSMIPTSARGSATPKARGPDRRRLRSFVIPHIAQEDTIYADQVQNVREFGSLDNLRGVQRVVNERFSNMTNDLDVTLEWHMLGAIKGQVLDADATTVLYDLFTEFGVTQMTQVALDLANLSPTPGALRRKLEVMVREFEDDMGLGTYDHIHVLVGKNFWDNLIQNKEVREVYLTQLNGEWLRQPTVRRGTFTYAGVVFEEYRGKIGAVSFIGDDEARAFPVGVPGLFQTYYAPADFMETVNTLGLPRYARTAPDPTGFNRYQMLHLQTNPLFLCTRPRMLRRIVHTA